MPRASGKPARATVQVVPTVGEWGFITARRPDEVDSGQYDPEGAASQEALRYDSEALGKTQEPKK